MDEFVKLTIAVQGKIVKYFRKNIEGYDGQVRIFQSTIECICTIIIILKRKN